MYQDTDFGKDVLAGVVEQTKAMSMKLVGQTAHKPTDTDFTAYLQRLREAKCDLIATGTIVRDTTMILSTAHKMGWEDVTFLGQFASYDTAVAEAPGGIGEGYYAVTPSLIAYPRRSAPGGAGVLAQGTRRGSASRPNFLGEIGYSAAQITLLALDRAGRDLTLDSFIKGDGEHQGLQRHLRLAAADLERHAASRLVAGAARGGEERQMGGGGGSPAGVLARGGDPLTPNPLPEGEGAEKPSPLGERGGERARRSALARGLARLQGDRSYCCRCPSRSAWRARRRCGSVCRSPGPRDHCPGSR